MPPLPDARTEDDEKAMAALHNDWYVGFCIAGYVLPNRKPQAFEVGFRVSMAAAQVPAPLTTTSLWGAPSIIFRLLLGFDGEARQSLLDSPKWTGTEADLDKIIYQNALSHPILPIRDAIDFVHTCIYSTIKALKFSSWSQICGGPIELAVITTDRHFRWVRHKEWDAGITEGERVA